MNIELWREIDNMVKYKAEKQHTHGWTWGVLIFLFLTICGMSNTIYELKDRIKYLEQVEMNHESR